MFSWIKKLNNWLFDRRYISFNSFDKVYDNLKNGEVIYVRTQNDECIKLIRKYNKIGVYTPDIICGISNYYFVGYITHEDKFNSDTLYVVNSTDRSKNFGFDIKRISTVQENCCVIGEVLTKDSSKLVEAVSKVLKNPIGNTSKEIFENIVKATLPDALDCFLIDDFGVHIVPNLVTEKFGHFTYKMEYGDTSYHYEWYLQDYCRSIITRRKGSDISPFLSKINDLMIEEKIFFADEN